MKALGQKDLADEGNHIPLARRLTGEPEGVRQRETGRGREADRVDPARLRDEHHGRTSWLSVMTLPGHPVRPTLAYPRDYLPSRMTTALQNTLKCSFQRLTRLGPHAACPLPTIL